MKLVPLYSSAQPEWSVRMLSYRQDNCHCGDHPARSQAGQQGTINLSDPDCTSPIHLAHASGMTYPYTLMARVSRPPGRLAQVEDVSERP